MERGGGRERERERETRDGKENRVAEPTYAHSMIRLWNSMVICHKSHPVRTRTKWLREDEDEKSGGERGNRIALSHWSLVHWCLDGIYMGALVGENWFNQMKDTKTLEMWLLSFALSPLTFSPLQVIERTINQQQRLRNSTPGLMTGQKGKSLH